jgi:hypothetical protein
MVIRIHQTRRMLAAVKVAAVSQRCNHARNRTQPRQRIFIASYTSGAILFSPSLACTRVIALSYLTLRRFFSSQRRVIYGRIAAR